MTKFPIEERTAEELDLDNPDKWFQGDEATERFDTYFKNMFRPAELTDREREIMADIRRRNGVT